MNTRTQGCINNICPEILLLIHEYACEQKVIKTTNGSYIVLIRKGNYNIFFTCHFLLNELPKKYSFMLVNNIENIRITIPELVEPLSNIDKFCRESTFMSRYFHNNYTEFWMSKDWYEKYLRKFYEIGYKNVVNLIDFLITISYEMKFIFNMMDDMKNEERLLDSNNNTCKPSGNDLFYKGIVYITINLKNGDFKSFHFEAVM